MTLCALNVVLIDPLAKGERVRAAPRIRRIVKPACRMIERSVPGFRSRFPCTGTVTVRDASPGNSMM
jgi:hypothetical protein